MKYSILSLILAILLASCHNHSEQNPQSQNKDENATSIKVDSIRIYKIENIPVDEFMFSPLEPKQKIWTSNSAKPHELDLKTGQWIALDSKFGQDIKGLVREDKIWKDPYTGDNYISFYHKGLLRCYAERDSFELINIRTVSAVHPRKEELLLGSVNGLYVMTRDDNTVKVADNFPVNIWVHSIEKLNKDTIVVNHKDLYCLKTSTYREGFVSIGKPKTDRDHRNYRYISSKERKSFHVLDGNFRVFMQDSIRWFYNRDQLFYSPDHRQLYKFENFPKGDVKHLLEDEFYLYILYKHQFVILNKAYVFKRSIAIDYLKHQKLHTDLDRRMNVLNAYKSSLESYLKHSIELYRDESFSSDKELQKRIEALPYHIQYYDFNEEPELYEKILKSDSVPDDYKYYILYGLCRKYTNLAEVETAKLYFEKIKEGFSREDYCIEYTYKAVAQAYHSIDSLKSFRLKADAYLYYETEAIRKMIAHSCWFGESCTDYSIVADRFKNLLSKYPDSPIADDAAFWLIGYDYYNGMEGGYSLSAIPKLNQFPQKYPKSKHIPELLFNIACSYYYTYEEDPVEKINHIDTALYMFKSIKDKYQLERRHLEQMRDIEREALHLKNTIRFELKIKPQKGNYKAGERILLDVVLKNRTTIPQKIKVYKNQDPFSFQVFPNKKVEFIAKEKGDTSSTFMIIEAEQSIRRTVELDQLIRSKDAGSLGHFSFKEEGLYFVTCFSDLNAISSKQAKIYIETKGNTRK